MPDTKMERMTRFTIWHGIATSVVLHSALALPFVVDVLPSPPDEPPLLVLDLQGVAADSQLDQKVKQQTQGAAEPEQTEKQKVAQADVPPPPEDPPKRVVEDGDAPPPPSVAQTASAAATQAGDSANNVKGTEVQQEARTIQATEKELVNAYVTLLSKKVRANIVYPNGGRVAAAVVSFTVLNSGQLRPDSVKIRESSGQAVLDASALKTIRASAPFDPPPRELNLAITVDFTGKR